jgi:hypothetical protein
MVFRYAHINILQVREAKKTWEHRHEQGELPIPQELRRDAHEVKTVKTKKPAALDIRAQAEWYPLLDKFRNALLEIPLDLEIMLRTSIQTAF